MELCSILGGQVGPVPEFFGFGLNVNLLYVPFSKMLCIIYYSVYMYIYVWMSWELHQS